MELDLTNNSIYFMSTKLFLGVMVVVLAIAGYVVYTNTMDEDSIPMMGNGISFICADSSYFSAEFSPDFSRVNIVVDGVVARSAGRVAGTDLYMYEEGDYIYTFAGEKVTVTNSRTGTATNCSQPFDPNNAPYNFGDMGEGAGEKPNIILAATENIEGKWQSVDDEKFLRQFQTDGTVTDSYEGQDDTVGSWVIFTMNSEVETPFTLEPNTAYLKITTEVGASEVMYYKLTKVTPEELELIYMDRGGVLRFTRVGSDANMETDVEIDVE